MTSIWMLPRFTNPIKAVQNGKDESVCGQCEFRPSKGGICYVNIAFAPNQIYKAYKEGKYPKLMDIAGIKEFFKGKVVRFGAWGEIVAIPFNITKTIAEVSDGFTGYSHAWKNKKFQGFRNYLMASVDNEEEQIQAAQQGWRTFRIKDSLDEIMPQEIVCPASIESGKKTTCSKCLLCNGNKDTNRRPFSTKHIVINAHGFSYKKDNYRRLSLPLI